jgi:radical SAM protein with 4Fe4S-binding SPASM domain
LWDKEDQKMVIPKYKIIETIECKVLRSKEYNYYFNKESGLFLRFGETYEKDPEYSPLGPEIIDMEISTVCHNKCKFCYKSNTSVGKNMSFDTFKKIFHKLPKTVCQIAFGIGSIDSNKDLFKIMYYCRRNCVIPNITINGSRMNKMYYNRLRRLCGAVSVSLYDYDTCYNAVKELTKCDMSGKIPLKQVNIHCLLSNETYDKCMQVLKDRLTDKRLSKLNAIVFLTLKPKGLRNTYTKLNDMNKLKKLVNFAFKNHISIGFDSCSSCNFLKSIRTSTNFNEISKFVEPCESTLFSYYINVNGKGYPCSFSENIQGYNGIDILKSKNFWFEKETIKFRKNVINNKDKYLNCRKCQLYDLEIRK